GRETGKEPGSLEAQRRAAALRCRPGHLRPHRGPVRLDSHRRRWDLYGNRGLRARREEVGGPGRRAVHGRHVRRPARRAGRDPRRRLRSRGGRLVPQHAHRALHGGL
ncbi:MAG: hypothetical protein AVDCRST_MAG55-2099, partial [uncultured Rubrobacteraceae bacterium]